MGLPQHIWPGFSLIRHIMPAEPSRGVSPSDSDPTPGAIHKHIITVSVIQHVRGPQDQWLELDLKQKRKLGFAVAVMIYLSWHPAHETLAKASQLASRVECEIIMNSRCPQWPVPLCGGCTCVSLCMVCECSLPVCSSVCLSVCMYRAL